MGYLDLMQGLPVLLGCLSNPSESWTVSESYILMSLKPNGIQGAIHLILKQTSVLNLMALYALTILRNRDFFIQISRCRCLIWDAIVPSCPFRGSWIFFRSYVIPTSPIQVFQIPQDISMALHAWLWITVEMDNTEPSWGHPELIFFSSVWPWRSGIRQYWLKLTGVLRAVWASLNISLKK